MAGKKRKSAEGAQDADPTARGGRTSTVSIAVAASCIENTQQLQLATLLAGQIARAAAIFNVDEVVVLDDCAVGGQGGVSAAAALFVRVLQFMETPQYLKKALVPVHQDLKFAGALPPLDAPHHLRTTEWFGYREGVVRSSTPGSGSLVDVGLDKDAHIPLAARPGVRVTLAMGDQPAVRQRGGQEVLGGQLVLSSEPRDKCGHYWGYATRVASSLQDMLEGCPWPGGYDLTVGTSERGECTPSCSLRLPQFRHLLIVFGGPTGLEPVLEADPWNAKYDSPEQLFGRYLNTCFDQGSRTIRTEEAVLISLAFLAPAVAAAARYAA